MPKTIFLDADGSAFNREAFVVAAAAEIDRLLVPEPSMLPLIHAELAIR